VGKKGDEGHKDAPEEVRKIVAHGTSQVWTLRVDSLVDGPRDVSFDLSEILRGVDKPARSIEPWAVGLPASLPEEPASPTWIEAVGSIDAGELVGRGYPHFPVGTLQIGADGEDPRAFFGDGTSIAVATGDGLPRSGPVSIHGLIKGETPPSAHIEAQAPLEVACEVVAVEKIDTDPVLLLSSSPDTPTWRMVAEAGVTVLSEPGLERTAPRLMTDIGVGDWIVASGHLSARGFEPIKRDDDAQRVEVRVGLRGTFRPQLLTALGVARTCFNYVPAMVTTPRGREVQAWIPGDELQAGEVVASSMPVIFAERILAHEALPAPSDGPDLEVAENTREPLHANVSDLIARWSGWSLALGVPGKTDNRKEQDDSDSPWKLKLLPPEPTDPTRRQARLRYNESYRFRLIRADLAGNNGFDDVLFGFVPPKPPAELAKPLPCYERPTPMQVAMIGHADPTHPSLTHAVDGSGGDGKVEKVRRVVIISDPLDQGTPPVWDLEQDLWVFPPPCPPETFLSWSVLDKLRGERVLRSVFRQCEGYVDHKAFGLARSNDRLNYFPDPEAADDVGRAGTRWTLWMETGNNLPSVASNMDFGLLSDWRSWSPRRLRLTSALRDALSTGSSGVDVLLPPARVRVVRIGHTNEGRFTEIDAIHAVSAPLERPLLVQAAALPRRKRGETRQSLTLAAEYEAASTGTISAESFWNDYWDEAVPPLFFPARAELTVENGSITSVDLRSAGNGFGTGVVTRVADPDHGELAEALASPDSEAGFLAGPESAPCTTQAEFGVALSADRVAGIKIQSGGTGYLGGGSGRLTLLVLRRPPLVHSAAAYVRSFGPHGEILDIGFITDEKGRPQRGGYYAAPPIVQLDDPDDGSRIREAEIKATLDDQGRVSGFLILNSGCGYSRRTAVRIFTNHSVVAQEELVRPPDVQPGDSGRIQLDVNQDFNDPFHHRLTLRVQGGSAFRRLFAKKDPKELWSDRSSPMRSVSAPSAERPPTPDISYVVPSFEARLHRHSPGQVLHESRYSAVRVYLHRPWHSEDRLCVVVLPVRQNTAQILPGVQSIPKSMRDQVSRWGYDPLWRPVYWPPLVLDDFEGGEVISYARLSEPETEHERPVALVAYEVSYDHAKELWFADIPLRLPSRGAPFVQLALARYQQESLPQVSLSHVRLTEMCPFPAERTLEIRRNEDGTAVTLLGPPDNYGPFMPENVEGMVRRRSFVELRRLPTTHSPLIEGEYFHGDEASDRILMSATQVGTHEAILPVSATKGVGAGAYLAIKELEIFPESATHALNANREDSAFGGQAVDRLVYTRSVHFETLSPLDL
jgi:hypothetical protein